MTRVVVPAIVLMAATAAVVLHGQSAPLSIVLLVDVSGSVSDAMATLAVERDREGTLRGTKAPNAPRDLFQRAVETGFIANLAAGDSARIGRVARHITLSDELTADSDALRQAARAVFDVEDENRYAGSPIWDGVVAAVDALAGQQGRRAVILVTDGLALGNRHSLGAAIERSNAAGVSISIVGEWWGAPRPYRSGFRGGVGSSDHTGSAWRMIVWPFGNSPDTNLKKLAAATGGLFVADGAPSAVRWRECGGSLGNSASCAGDDPDPAAALTNVLEFLHRP
jgi:hypothetical protein